MARKQFNSFVTIALTVSLFFLIIYLVLHFRGSLPNDDLHSTNKPPGGDRQRPNRDNTLTDFTSKLNSELAEREREMDEQKKFLQTLRADLVEREEQLQKKENLLQEREARLLGTEAHSLTSIQESIQKLQRKVETGITVPGGGIGQGSSRTITTRDELLLPALAPPVNVGKAKFAIITAYKGELYETMGMIADLTKERYCELHGYHFFNDPSLFHDQMTWNQKSAIRLDLYRKYLADYEWVVWSDSDVIIVNPNAKLESLVDDDHDAIISRDWGDRQVNPGSMILRNSPGGWKILDLWVEYIAKPETYHDDLRAFQLLTSERKDIDQRVKYVRQHSLNAYPHFGMRDKSYDQLLNPDNQHDLWKPGDFVVHIVDCIRDGGKKDPVCCAGLAAWYMKEFEVAYRKIIDDMRSRGAVRRRQEGELLLAKA